MSFGKEEPQDNKERLVMRVQDDASIAPIIKKACANGWKIISARGSLELCRAVWIEGTMNGIEVKGYEPSGADLELISGLKKQHRGDGKLVMRADEVVQDYCRRVIPQLEREYELLRHQRMRLGITTTDIDRTYGINLPTGDNRGVDDKFTRARGALIRAVEEREYFGKLGRQPVEVYQTFEDGVARFESVEKKYGHKRDQAISRDLKRAY